ncbi:GntR family transcriptional regulator [Leifsonia aquatica]|uniref:GntR family transcriptional regulator n=1 Tax=Leifsonia aquatica TaxID=144185 RepID=UPI000469396E|nr:GntR family transcriptional regulator [Leifsonia aquatica]
MVPLSNRRLLSEDVFDILCDELVDTTLAPGEQLDVDQIADRFGVSRTPVRDALARLIRAGLVEASPNRYTRVADVIDDDLVRSIHLLRGTLDLRLQEQRITPERELELAYRIGLAARGDDVGVDLFEAIARFLIQADASPLVDQLSEIVLPRTLRLLRHHPELVRGVGGASELRLLAEEVASDPDAARTRLHRILTALATEVADRLPA